MKRIYPIFQITSFAIITLVAGYFYIDIALGLTDEVEGKKMIGQLFLFIATLSTGYLLYLYQSNDQRKRDETIKEDSWKRQQDQQRHESFENFKKS